MKTRQTIPSLHFTYWSVATGEQDTQSLTECIQSARRVGVYRPFHVLSDRPLADCECYDAMEVDRQGGFHKLIYLKAAMSRLAFDYYVWIEPSTRFQRAPGHLGDALGHSPIHVPLCSRWPHGHTRAHGSEPAPTAREFMIRSGLPDRPYFGSSSFWIVHRHAIDAITSSAIEFWREATKEGIDVNVDTALAFSMQLFCGDPRKHCWLSRPTLWLPKESHVPVTPEILRGAALITDTSQRYASADIDRRLVDPRRSFGKNPGCHHP